MSLRVLQVPITKKGHCLGFCVTIVKRENSLEPFLQVFFQISFGAKSEGAVLECRSRKHTRSLTLAGDSVTEDIFDIYYSIIISDF